MEELAGVKLAVAGTGKPRQSGLVNSVQVEWIRYALIAIYVIPLLVIAYLYIQYIYPMFTASGNEVMALGVSAVLTLAVVLSVLGLALLSRSAKESVDSLNTLNARMDSLLSATTHFEQTGHVDTLVDSVAKSAKDVLNGEASSLLLYDDEGNLRFEYVEGPAADKLMGKAVKIGEGITGWAAQQRKAVIVNDVANDPRFAKSFDKKSGFMTNAIICVPLVFDGRDLGILEVINKRDGGVFGEHDKNTLTSLAEHAAASIYRNKTYDEMKSDFIQVTDLLVMAVDSLMPQKMGHCRRVARYSVKLAKGMGLKENEVRTVYFGALLHDVGLVKLDVLGSIDKEKYKLHAAAGGEMVKNVYQWKNVAQMIRDHHERPDGLGYPAGLSGTDISVGGRIIGLAEAFDVMTSRHSYKPAISFDEAATEIKILAGYQFDPEVVNVFLKMFSADDAEDA